MDRVNLLNLPTPLHEIEVDDKNNKYFIKRDDLTDFALGGNKARKIEYFLYDIVQKECDYIVTYGSAQSNHCRIIAAVAARMGIKCLLILAGSERDLTYNGNDLLYFLADAKIEWCNVNKVSKTIELELERLNKQGYKPYFIPGGGHGNCGTHAYFETYREIKEQANDMGIKFDYIFLASGTGTTQAGLIAGKKYFQGTEEIIGISIARKAVRGKEVINESLTSYFKELKSSISIQDYDIKFDDSYIGLGYADIYKEVVDTIRTMYVKNSIVLDPVYTGKAFWGMCEYIKNNYIKGKNILFIHTGGLPIIFSNGAKVKEVLW